MVPKVASAPRAGALTTSAPPTTPKPLPRRPTLVRKRDDTTAEDESPRPTSPKKARVAFNNEVEVKVMEQWGKSPALIRDEVRRALERHARGDRWEYESLKELYDADADVAAKPDTSVLKSYTTAIGGHASTLGRAHRDLVQAMLQSDWILRDDDYVALFQRFLGSLASTQGIWLSDILAFLVDMFKKSPAQEDASELPPSVIRQRVHATLGILLRLIPSASGVLASVLSNAYPSLSDSRRRHVVYVRNALRITSYAPELQAEIMSLVANELVKIDVQVQIDLMDLADDAGDSLVKQLQRTSTLDDASDDGVESESEEEPDDDVEVNQDEKRAKQIGAHIEKLDVIMDILFESYTRLAQQPSTAFFVTDTLLAQFNSLVLPSYKSRHVQFLLFHFAQQTAEGMDRFAGALMSVVLDNSRPSLIRESAAAYLASFVARGNHVPGSTVRDVFEYLGAQLAGMRAAYEPSCRGPDPRRYRTYYALTQALLYIFCFRWRDLTVTAERDEAASAGGDAGISPMSTSEDEDGPDDPLDPDRAPVFLRSVRAALRDNIFSRLNPLRVCAPVIVAEFARATLRLRFLYVYTLLEANRRVRLPTGPTAAVAGPLGASAVDRGSALSARKDQDWQRLDAYFPFDPYRLPRSRRWVEDDYREWVGVPGPGDNEASESEEGADDSEDESGGEE